MSTHEQSPVPPGAGRSEADIIARNLDALFKTERQPDGRKHPMEDVAVYVSERVGVSVSRSWVSRLRAGDITAPEPARLEAVAQFFGKSAAYLRADDPDAVEQDPEHVARVKEWRDIAALAEDLGTQGLNLRQLHELSAEDLGVVRAVVERLRAAHNEHRGG